MNPTLERHTQLVPGFSGLPSHTSQRTNQSLAKGVSVPKLDQTDNKTD